MSRRKRCWKGGAQTVFPAGVEDDSMLSASKLSSAQGLDYARLHLGQHGGAAVSLANSAPPGYTGMLDDSLRATARVEVLDQSMHGIQGMSDQSGGSRKRGKKARSMRRKKNGIMMGGKRRKSMSMCKKKGMCMQGGKRRKSMSMRKKKGMYMQGGKRGKKSRSMRKKKNGNMMGGSGFSLAHAQDVGAPGMLLSPNQEATALQGMNPEWKLAADPGAFKPAGM